MKQAILLVAKENDLQRETRAEKIVVLVCVANRLGASLNFRQNFKCLELGWDIGEIGCGERI